MARPARVSVRTRRPALDAPLAPVITNTHRRVESEVDADASQRRDRTASAPARALSAVDWLTGPILLCATACAMLLVFRGPDRLFGIVLTCLVALGVTWVLVCVFFPARADRRCPQCGREELRRLDPHTTRGVVCGTCGGLDRDQSSFLMAEEDEEAVEPLVMRERQRQQ